MLDQAHMTSLFENATEGIILTDRHGKIILANPAAERMFGYSDEELRDLPVEVLIPGNFRSGHKSLREGFHKNPSNRSMGAGRDLFALKKNGEEFPVEISLSHYTKDGVLFVIAFIVDITLRKEVEKNLVKKQNELEKVTYEIRKLNTELERKVDERTYILKEALEKLEQSQTELHEALDKERLLNEIKSRFVSMASHEFRTPLSAVLSSATLLSKYTKEDDQEKRDKHIGRIKDSVKHLNDILEDFLSLGKLDEGRISADPHEFNLNELVNETLADVKVVLKPGQKFVFDFEGQELVNSDKKLLKNILINLLSNAAKFSPEDSPIEIMVNSGPGQAMLTVKDHGIGISEKDQEHLFNMFYRASNVTNIQGTGLGLHIVKRYLDLIHGTVNLHSQLGKGTSITITFPNKSNENS
ncbi:MAG TPA: PAS domain-containing sensor histidine kinase [Chitinophagaceae bacterium]|nr:PAS domain-containing sensor histidine kinase [Chitinophagaceae bacterium]